jgi:hypothetical protein
MKCPKCQFENPVGVNFCVECGNKLEKICSSCGYSNLPSYKFCGGCGCQLSLPAETHSKDLPLDEKLTKTQRYLPRGLTEKILSQIKMRIGIHTGPVVVGTLGDDLRVEFKAVGDTVNLASRMENLAAPGATYVTEETFKLAEGLFRFEALGEKGWVKNFSSKEE